MLVPPKSDEWMSKIDPTKLKNRKFTSSSSGSAGAVSTIWTETPEEKRKRLENQVMGVSSSSQDDKGSKAISQEDYVTAKRIQEYNVS
jgi:hypothetical protein